MKKFNTKSFELDVDVKSAIPIYEQIKNAIIGLCKKNKMKKSCYIRPFYFVGNYGINLHVTEKAPTNVAIFMFPFGDLFSKKGITAGVSSWRKFSVLSTPPQAKMGGNYLNSIFNTPNSKFQLLQFLNSLSETSLPASAFPLLHSFNGLYPAGYSQPSR